MRYGTGVALVLAAGLAWSFQALIIRQIDAAGSWAVLFWRSLWMLPVLALFLAWQTGGAPLAAIRKAGAAGMVGGLGLVAAMGGAVVAFQTTTVANAAFLMAAAPLLAAILGRLVLGEPVAPRTWVAIGMAVAGILVMVNGALAAGEWLGNAAALASALGFAVFSVALRWRRLDDSLPLSVLGSLLATIAGAGAAFQAGQTLGIPAAEIGWCALMGMVTLSGGMILFTLGSRVVPSGELVLMSNVEIILAPVWVWLLLGETASASTLAGGGVVMAAILFNGLGGMRRQALA